MELGEMTELKESLLREIREMEKKVKSTQHEKDTLLANLQQSDRAKRTVSYYSPSNPFKNVFFQLIEDVDSWPSGLGRRAYRT